MTLPPRQSGPMIVNDISGVGAVIGINIKFVQDLLDKNIYYYGEIIDSFHGITNTILGTLGARWGTEDSYNEVETIIQEFKDCSKRIGSQFDHITKIILKNANKQVQATNNTNDLVVKYSYDRDKDDWFTYKNYQKPILENGYVGVASDLIKDVQDHVDILNNEIAADLRKYRSELVYLSRKAFSDKKNTFANNIDNLIGTMSSDIRKTIDKSVDLVKAKTKNAVQLQMDSMGNIIVNN